MIANRNPYWGVMISCYMKYMPPKCLRSSLACFSFVLRSSFDCSSIVYRRKNEGRTKDERRMNENLSRIDREVNEKLTRSDRKAIGCFLCFYFIKKT